MTGSSNIFVHQFNASVWRVKTLAADLSERGVSVQQQVSLCATEAKLAPSRSCRSTVETACFPKRRSDVNGYQYS